MNIDWNVKEYLKDFAFVPKYGEAVLDMIDAAPGPLPLFGRRDLEQVRNGGDQNS